MYKYQVEVFEKNKNPFHFFPFKKIIYETITADGYCAEIEARQKYPNAKIGEVTRVGDYIDNLSL
jgi:hypothetical protein